MISSIQSITNITRKANMPRRARSKSREDSNRNDLAKNSERDLDVSVANVNKRRKTEAKAKNDDKKQVKEVANKKKRSTRHEETEISASFIEGDQIVRMEVEASSNEQPQNSSTEINERDTSESEMDCSDVQMSHQ